MQLPAPGDTLVTHSANAIPETLFHIEILLRASCPNFSFFQVEFRLKKKGDERGGSRQIKHFLCCNDLQDQRTLDLCSSFSNQYLVEQEDLIEIMSEYMFIRLGRKWLIIPLDLLYLTHLLVFI